jgi:hypothetical protein
MGGIADPADTFFDIDADRQMGDTLFIVWTTYS